MNPFKLVDLCSIKENAAKNLQNKGILHIERTCECGSDVQLKLSEKEDQSFVKIKLWLGGTGKVPNAVFGRRVFSRIHQSYCYSALGWF